MTSFSTLISFNISENLGFLFTPNNLIFSGVFVSIIVTYLSHTILNRILKFSVITKEKRKLKSSFTWVSCLFTAVTIIVVIILSFYEINNIRPTQHVVKFNEMYYNETDAEYDYNRLKKMIFEGEPLYEITGYEGDKINLNEFVFWIEDGDNGDFYVAVKTDDFGYFVLTDEYAASGIEIGDLSDESLAASFAQYIKENELSGTTKNINKKGEVVFDELESGLYLFVQKKAASGYAKMKPFLVSLPALVDGEYVYEVNASPKTGIEPQKPKPSDPPPNLPQTGQDNVWVPVLATGGILLVVMGICLIVGGKKKKHES